MLPPLSARCGPRKAPNFRSFCTLNATAIGKILKKHDKLLGTAWKKAYTGAAERCSFWDSGPKTIGKLAEVIEDVYADAFTGGRESRGIPTDSRYGPT